MASQSVKQAFTILESLVALFIFVTMIVLVAQIYFNLMKSAVSAQNIQLSLDNLRFGSEKIWSEVKTGSDFNIASSSIDFKNRRCQSIKIYKDGNNINLEVSSQRIPLFDANLVEVNDFKIYADSPISSGFYFQSANKIILFYYDVNLKTRIGNIPLRFWQTVAPSNSVLINNPCD